jgi:thioredoxin 1
MAVLCLALFLAAVGCSKPSASPVPPAASVPASATPRETAPSASPTASTAGGPFVKAEVGSVGDSPAQPATTEPLAATLPESERLPRLVDLGAGKCIPCKKMAPILEELAETHKAYFKVEFIDVWVNPSMAKEYNVRIIPTQVFYDAGGRELYRHIGFYSKEEILDKWRGLGVDVGK